LTAAVIDALSYFFFILTPGNRLFENGSCKDQSIPTKCRIG
jgi:hypothetical protein